LTLDLPEFSTQPILWHESLDPMIVNVDSGRLYVVGTAPTEREFDLYGKPRPPYVGFIWEGSAWKRIPFDGIPQAIYTTNMLIESVPDAGTNMLTEVRKESAEVNGKATYRKPLKRIDPTYRSNSD
jgi:hypothetical protein